MHARLLLLISLMLLTGFAPAPFARTPRNDPTDHVRRLQGEWVVLEFRFGGKKVGRGKDDPGGDVVLCVSKDRWAFSQGGQRGNRYDVLLNPAKRALDLTDVVNSTNVLLAIYQFEGNKLTVTYADDRRPTGFESHGARYWQMVLKRR